jgi:hypothetical protein
MSASWPVDSSSERSKGTQEPDKSGEGNRNDSEDGGSDRDDSVRGKGFALRIEMRPDLDFLAYITTMILRFKLLPGTEDISLVPDQAIDSSRTSDLD